MSDTLSKIITYPTGASIYISGIQPYYSTRNEFQTHNIQTIISLLCDQTPPNLNPYGIEHYFFKIKDEPNIRIDALFYKTSNIILRSVLKGHNVLVHCRAGISRSVSIVIAFFLSCLMCYPKLVRPYISKSESSWTMSILKYIQSKRSIVGPNPGFIQQLVEYEQYLDENRLKIKC
jgi:protein-tyrosine phosphatase